MSRRGQRVVSFKLDHGPNHHAHSCQGLFERVKLCEQCALDPGARLVTRPQFVAEGFNDVIGGHTDVCRAVLDHFRRHVQHARDSAKRRIGFMKAPQTVEMPEEFVSPVDKVNNHRVESLSF